VVEWRKNQIEDAMTNTSAAQRSFVAYYRVSTTGQGESGLGLDAQKLAVLTYLATVVDSECIAELIEIESGKRKDRPQLVEAIKIARRKKATLVIAKLDRLARNVHFVSGLMESGVEFVACDNPHANRLMVHMLAAFAEHERDMISLRTKEGLKAARARGRVLGATGKIRAAENRQQADKHALAILDDIRAIPKQERSSVTALARAMNDYSVSTMRGGRWHRPAVYRLMERYQRLGVAV